MNVSLFRNSANVLSEIIGYGINDISLLFLSTNIVDYFQEASDFHDKSEDSLNFSWNSNGSIPYTIIRCVKILPNWYMVKSIEVDYSLHYVTPENPEDAVFIKLF